MVMSRTAGAGSPDPEDAPVLTGEWTAFDLCKAAMGSGGLFTLSLHTSDAPEGVAQPQLAVLFNRTEKPA